MTGIAPNPLQEQGSTPGTFRRSLVSETRFESGPGTLGDHLTKTVI